MKVNIRQFSFDTDEMSVYHTGSPSIPAIFINSTGTTFVQQCRKSWPEPKVRHLPRSEALRLAEYYRIAELKERLAQFRPMATADERMSA